VTRCERDQDRSFWEGFNDHEPDGHGGQCEGLEHAVAALVRSRHLQRVTTRCQQSRANAPVVTGSMCGARHPLQSFTQLSPSYGTITEGEPSRCGRRPAVLANRRVVIRAAALESYMDRRPSRSVRSRTCNSCACVHGGPGISPRDSQRLMTGGETLHTAAASRTEEVTSDIERSVEVPAYGAECVATLLSNGTPRCAWVVIGSVR
jgi:hypothetical protein